MIEQYSEGYTFWFIISLILTQESTH